jgi:hypothetical protein
MNLNAIVYGKRPWSGKPSIHRFQFYGELVAWNQINHRDIEGDNEGIIETFGLYKTINNRFILHIDKLNETGDDISEYIIVKSLDSLRNFGIQPEGLHFINYD